MGLLSVIVDSREADYIQQLHFGGVPCLVSALDAGDLLAACEDGALLAIERKTANDFLNTLRDDRLFGQLAKLREQTPWAYLVVCGDLRPGPGNKCHCDGRETGWNWASVSGALLTVQEIGVHVVTVAGDHEYEAAVIRLANRDRQSLRIKPARDLTLTSEAELILSSLPGIGAERVQALLSVCPSPAWALTWLTNDTAPDLVVPGVGLRTKEKIRTALGLQADEYLSVVVKETTEPATQRKEVAA